MVYIGAIPILFDSFFGGSLSKFLIETLKLNSLSTKFFNFSIFLENLTRDLIFDGLFIEEGVVLDKVGGHYCP